MADGSQRITKRTVDALKPGGLVWDADVRGFGVRCQRRDKVYVVKAKSKGSWRWFRIGIHGSPWTPEAAREKAKAILGQIAEKKDPAAIRDAEKANPTVGKLAEWFLAEHVEAKRRPRTLASYKDLLDRLAVPVLGKTKVADVTREDIAKLHHAHKTTPYQANRMLAVLSKMFAWAEGRGYRAEGTNPCHHIEKYGERRRERFLSEIELAALGDVLSEGERDNRESAYVVGAIRLLMFTGARLGEILSLRWGHVDTEKAMLFLPESKTGQKAVWLSAPALETLSAIPRMEKNPHVICGDKEGRPLVNLEKAWRRIRERATVRLWARDGNKKVSDVVAELAKTLGREPPHTECLAAAKKADVELPVGLADVRLHDLRHSFASVGASGGLSLPMIGKLLGHSQAATTARYAHLAADPVRAANEAIGRTIAAAMKGGPGAEIFAINEKGKRS